jgi:hypothetical protein
MKFRLIELFIVISVASFACAALSRPEGIMESLFYSFTLLMILVSAVLCIAQCGARRCFWAGFLLCSGSYLFFVHQKPQNVGLNPYVQTDGKLATTQLIYISYRGLFGESAWVPSHGGVFCIQSGSKGLHANDGVQSSEIGQDPKKNDAPFSKNSDENAENGRDVSDLINRIQDTSNPEERTDSADGAAASAPGLRIFYAGGQQVMPQPSTRGFPHYYGFVVIGHCCWALLFGWLGGHLAKWVYVESPSKGNSAAE